MLVEDIAEEVGEGRFAHIFCWSSGSVGRRLVALWVALAHGGFWGGYYGTAWASPPVTTTRTDTHFSVETLIYDLRQNKLVWAARSKTTNPEDVEQFVNELATAVAAEIKADKLIAK